MVKGLKYRRLIRLRHAAVCWNNVITALKSCLRKALPEAAERDCDRLGQPGVRSQLLHEARKGIFCIFQTPYTIRIKNTYSHGDIEEY